MTDLEILKEYIKEMQNRGYTLTEAIKLLTDPKGLGIAVDMVLEGKI